MTDELIWRKAAIAAANSGVLKYLTEEFETPPEVYVEEAIRALPAADTSALGAVVMRDTCLDVYVKGDWDWFSDAHDAMAEIPLPTPAQILAAALAVPEVAALVDTAQWARNRLNIIADESWYGDGRDLKRSIIGVFADFDASLLACGSAMPEQFTALEASHDPE